MARKMLNSAFVLAAGLAALPAQAKTPPLPPSVTVQLPGGMEPFPGPGAEAINRNCLSCHSQEMVLYQPPMPKAAWEAEVNKMRNVYKAPVVESDIPAIVDYIVHLNQ